jgi:CubicO group peptidase (beta-lactamase class C family)
MRTRLAATGLLIAALVAVNPTQHRHDAVQHVLDQAVAGGLPGISAEISEQVSGSAAARRTWFGTAGVADITSGRGRRPPDRFRIGSTTKTFVATVVLQLVGIAMAHPAPFAPGTSWGYSNTNYIVLGLVVERITGRPLAQEIARRIAGPLGLTGTYLPAGTAIRGPHGEEYSKLYLPDPTPIYDVTELSPSWSWAAGGLVSNVGDLTRFFGALLAGRLLPPAEQRAMFTTRPTIGWIPNTTYGLGMSSITLSCGRVVWGMGGAISGSFSYSYGTRDGRTVLAINVNGDWNNPIGTFTQALEAQFCPTTGGVEG